MHLRRNLLAIVLSVVPLALAACGGNTGGYAPDPAPYVPPPAELTKAKDARFKPVVEALLAQRAAAKAMNDFRAAAVGDMTEEQSAKYAQLFAKTAAAGQKVSDVIGAANFTAEEQATFEVIAALDDATLATLKN
ncbi:MAG: hypothetical protein ACKOYN_03805 [Planctomycetota bacterium]